MQTYKSIKGHLNENQQITSWPAKRSKVKVAITYLATKFDFDRKYTEKEVNEILNQHHTFSDAALLRREMFGYKLLGRTLDGREYWLVKREVETQ